MDSHFSFIPSSFLTNLLAILLTKCLTVRPLHAIDTNPPSSLVNTVKEALNIGENRDKRFREWSS